MPKGHSVDVITINIPLSTSGVLGNKLERVTTKSILFVLLYHSYIVLLENDIFTFWCWILVIFYWSIRDYVPFRHQIFASGIIEEKSERMKIF